MPALLVAADAGRCFGNIGEKPHMNPQPAQPIHADLYTLHSQAVQCEVEGFSALADAIRRNLAYLMRERGVAVLTLAGQEKAGKGGL